MLVSGGVLCFFIKLISLKEVKMELSNAVVSFISLVAESPNLQQAFSTAQGPNDLFMNPGSFDLTQAEQEAVGSLSTQEQTFIRCLHEAGVDEQNQVTAIVYGFDTVAGSTTVAIKESAMPEAEACL